MPGCENRGDVIRGSEFGLVEELKRRSESCLDAPAILAPGRDPVTYRELCREAGELARTLRTMGLERCDTVALVLPDGPEVLPAFLGVTDVAACAPLNPALRESEFEFFLRDLGARAVILPAAAASPARSAAKSLGISVLDGGREAELCRRTHPMEDDGAVLLLYTSGTTGGAKLVPLTASNFRAMLVNAQRTFGLGAGDRFLAMMPLFHAQGLISSCAQLMAGGAVICTPGFHAGSFPDWVEDFRPTWYTAGPTLHRAILAVARATPWMIERCSLRFVRSIGGALPASLLAELEDVLHVPVLEGYGSTEAGSVTSNGILACRGSVGRSVGPEVAIMSDSGVLLPPGEEGEIVLRGPAVMSGYRHNPEANRAAFHDGWFRTGDLGWLDEDGFLFLTGRLKEVISRGGEKVLPGEIDAVLAGHPAVVDVAAFAMRHPTLDEEVAAAVVVREGEMVAEQELRQLAATRLAPFKVPRRIFFVEAIPKNATGKPKRVALSEQLAAESSYVAPSSQAEKELAGIWSRILKKDKVGRSDDFFSLGGDSFGLTVMLTEVQAHFLGDRELDTSDFLASPDLATLARCIETCQSAAAPQRRSAVVTLQPHGSNAPFFFVPGASEDPFYFRHVAMQLGADRPTHVLRDPRPPEERGDESVEEVAARLVDALRAVQAQGPYCIGGHCYGGAVAYEMARRLMEMGEKVGALVLFDTPMPGYPRVLRNRRLFWERWKRHVRKVRHDGAAAALRVSLSQAVQLGKLVMRNASSLASDGPSSKEETNTVALLRHRPREYEGAVVQFIGLEDWDSDSVLDSRQGWRTKVAQFRVIKVPGSHESMFAEANAGKVAECLGPLLDAADH